jgi:hypothetical protein
MKQRCQACGVEKDTENEEIYPYPDELDRFEDRKPIAPFLSLDCQGPSVDGVTDWRVVTVCHDCFHRLDPDMWISDRCWLSLNPVTPFEQLPKLQMT